MNTCAARTTFLARYEFLCFSEGERCTRPRVGLYTILSPPIVYGVWHTKKGSVGRA